MATKDKKFNNPVHSSPPQHRLTRVSVRGPYLVCIPCLIGLMYVANLAEYPTPKPALIRAVIQMFLWANTHRSAGCAWNEIVDCDLDRQTKRCCLRPRATHFVQVILGLNFAWAINLAAHMLNIDPWGEATKVSTVCFFSVIVTIAVFYDTIYASQDTADDVKSGVKGRAVLFKKHILSCLVTLALAVAVLLHTSASAIGMAIPYYSLSEYVTCRLLSLLLVTG
ncbi:hypothetical protein BJX96DRAFT_183338 [Aspergillus floccosus]